jgi:Fe-S oxidoreductase
VILWDDTFVRYHEPQIGKAAVTVLEAAGYQVELLTNRRCCGRPAFSQGLLEKAAALGAHNLEQIEVAASDLPILFLEPSCYSMFVEDYRELRIPRAEEIARRCYLFEDFLEQLLAAEPDALRFRKAPGSLAIHAHCHARSLLDVSFMGKLASRIPGSSSALLPTGCCGMAGAFGALQPKYKLSLQVAEPLVRLLQKQPAQTTVVASGTSCRHQIEHLTGLQPKHMAEVLAGTLIS